MRQVREAFHSSDGEDRTSNSVPHAYSLDICLLNIYCLIGFVLSTGGRSLNQGSHPHEACILVEQTSDPPANK